VSSGIREGQDTDLNLGVLIVSGSFCVQGKDSTNFIGLAECTQYFISLASYRRGFRKSKNSYSAKTNKIYIRAPTPVTKMLSFDDGDTLELSYIQVQYLWIR
jgi:hypothetical protein